MIRESRTKFADEGLAFTFTFFRITSEIFQFGTCQFNIIARSKKAIFRANFSSWRFDLGKIFKIILFSRGPRTPYCNAQSCDYTLEHKTGARARTCACTHVQVLVYPRTCARAHVQVLVLPPPACYSNTSAS